MTPVSVWEAGGFDEQDWPQAPRPPQEGRQPRQAPQHLTVVALAGAAVPRVEGPVPVDGAFAGPAQVSVELETMIWKLELHLADTEHHSLAQSGRRALRA